MHFAWFMGFYKAILFKLPFQYMPFGGEDKGKENLKGSHKCYVMGLVKSISHDKNTNWVLFGLLLGSRWTYIIFGIGEHNI